MRTRRPSIDLCWAALVVLSVLAASCARPGESAGDAGSLASAPSASGVPESTASGPGDLPSSPGDLPSSPGDLPSSPGDLPSSPGDLPSSPGDLPPDAGRTSGAIPTPGHSPTATANSGPPSTASASASASAPFRLPGHDGPPRTAAPGTGQQAITYHGLTVDVPRAWKLNDYACGPQSNTVLLPGPRDACGPPPQTVTTVEFIGWPTPGLLPPELGSRTGTLDGATATLTSGWLDNAGFGDAPGPRLWVRAIAVPDLRALVVVTSPDKAIVDRIADTARVVDVDSVGCDVVAADTLALPPASSASAPAGATTTIIPGRPSALRICRYDNGLLEHGISLAPSGAEGPSSGSSAGTIEEFQAMLGRAARGTYRIPTANYSAEVCRDPATPLGDTNGIQSDGEGYRIVAQYPDGTSLTAIARINVCGDLGVSNGWYTVQPTTELATWLARLGSGGFFGPLPGDSGTAEVETAPPPTS